MELSENEKELIRNYRNSNKEDQLIITKRARLFAALADKTRREKK